jgi:HAD superfamily hydrolase (TIGR01509 family)
MAYKALIFDFDGIITDTEPVHMEAWQGVLEPLGVFFDEDEFRTHYLGLNDRDFLESLCRIHKHHMSEAERADLIEQKAIATMGLLTQEIPLLPGVAAFIEESRKHFLLAICSGANRGEIEFILRHLKWMDFFRPIVAADSVVRGKPDPEGYIRALEGLQERRHPPLRAGEVIAIEDSPRGIAAAKAAGLACLAVATSFERTMLAQADWIVDSLTEASIEEWK